MLTAEVATDCFLTAQVIGHVGSSEVAGNDTLNAHRLARARADAVQATLIAGGLPAKAIASVWDWQFMVREARATLWVFRLTPGEDCEGEPLDSRAAPLVAQAESGAAPPQNPQLPAAGTTAAAAGASGAPALAAAPPTKPGSRRRSNPCRRRSPPYRPVRPRRRSKRRALSRPCPPSARPRRSRRPERPKPRPPQPRRPQSSPS